MAGPGFEPATPGFAVRQKFIVSLALNNDEIVFEHFSGFDWVAIHGLRITTIIIAVNRVFIYWVSPRGQNSFLIYLFTGECNPNKHMLVCVCVLFLFYSFLTIHAYFGGKYISFPCISGK